MLCAAGWNLFDRPPKANSARRTKNCFILTTEADEQSAPARINLQEGGLITRTTALVLSLFIGSIVPLTAQAQSTITQEEAHAIAVDAYIYFYPLMSMDLSRKQFTNGTNDFKGPMNTLSTCPHIHQQISKGSCGPTSTLCIPSHGWT